MQKHKQAKLLKRIPSFYFILNLPKREDVTSSLFILSFFFFIYREIFVMRSLDKKYGASSNGLITIPSFPF